MNPSTWLQVGGFLFLLGRNVGEASYKKWA